MSALFPNVPVNIPGVPPVLRRATTLIDAYEPFLRKDSDEVDALVDVQWGVFDIGGNQVLEPDSVVRFEYGIESRIADFPVEQGGFESYNKVAVPFEIRLAMTKSGTVAEKDEFLGLLETLRASTELFTVVTPEQVYQNVSFERVGMARSAESGAGMLTVEMTLREVRENTSVAFSRAAPETSETDSDAPASAPPAASSSGVKPPTGGAKTVRTPAAARTKAQGAVQPVKLPNVAKVKNVPGVGNLATTKSGKQLYLYDKPVGR